MILLDYHNVIIKNTLEARLKEYVNTKDQDEKLKYNEIKKNLPT